ncbi:hypothetical protein SLEP1_g54690 [Rubroshorea leprosula]|uniref:NB-ARC domain-containing protein n=1 Tax=Rubroshorea leprosula TaxID=152421 RepID=A0AAV5MGC2_9ROSI|nr:hypothetical protein SLEP1_g54690 [Rubroshorea leprosula]
MDLLGSIIEIVKCVGGPIVRHLKHQIKFNDSLEKFKRRKDDLRSRRCDIESKLSTERRYGKVPRVEVQRWLDDAEVFIARPEVEDEVNGWGCLSCCCRVKILEGRVQELNEIYGRGDRYTDECLVIDDPSASVVELTTSELQGSEAVKANILACLKGEEVTMLGVWGMGGVGKTTIMKHVHNELLKEGKFKKIIWVTVSQNFYIPKLQDQIACSLNLKEKLEERQNESIRAGVLSKMLEEQKPYLLILDDVWCSFELETVGIPKPNGCKLVLTTRSLEVVRSLGCREIKVKILPQKEALNLFLNKVGDAVLSDHEGGIKKDLESTLKEIVDECDGLPLALITVAGSLKGISESRLWSVALNQLRDCKRNVTGTDDADAFQILKFSYDRLRSQQMQYCFLYCALYPEDYKIPKDEIIEYWIGEGFIDEMETWHAMKDEGYHILRKLEENSLLELIEDGVGAYVRRHDLISDEVRAYVRMHDLIRDMALYIIRMSPRMSPRFLLEAGKALTELPERVISAKGVEKVSLMHNHIEEIPSNLVSSTWTRVTTLLLANNKLSTIPESVFEHMPELRILDLSFNLQLSSLPNSVSKLVKLTFLLLEDTSLERVPSLSGLESLKKLNLRGRRIKEVPEGLGMLKNLKCLFLWVSQKGYMKLKGDVVGRLKKLEVFQGWFPTANEMRIFLKCEPNRLSDYFIIVGSNLNMSYRLPIKLPRYKKIMVFEETSIVGENMVFPSVQELRIEACHDIRSLNDISVIKDATELRRCLISKCDGMECFLSSWINNPVVQNLECLDLSNLHKLDGLFEANVMATSSPPPRAFSSLQEVWIHECKKIRKLFSSWKLVEYLQSLERIEVYDCEEMEEVIASDPEEEGEEGGDTIKKLILPKLKYLSLQNLPALKSICSRRAVMVCDSLEEIRICDCKGLRRMPLSLPLVDNAQPSPPPPTLKEILILQRELEWWEALEWDHPNAKDLLRPIVRFFG